MIFTYTRWVIFYEKSGLKVFKNNSIRYAIDMLAHDEFEFDKCEDLKNCMYCEYVTIYGRV